MEEFRFVKAIRNGRLDLVKKYFYPKCYALLSLIITCDNYDIFEYVITSSKNIKLIEPLKVSTTTNKRFTNLMKLNNIPFEFDYASKDYMQIYTEYENGSEIYNLEYIENMFAKKKYLNVLKRSLRDMAESEDCNVRALFYLVNKMQFTSSFVLTSNNLTLIKMCDIRFTRGDFSHACLHNSLEIVKYVHEQLKTINEEAGDICGIIRRLLYTYDKSKSNFITKLIYLIESFGIRKLELDYDDLEDIQVDRFEYLVENNIVIMTEDVFEKLVSFGLDYLIMREIEEGCVKLKHYIPTDFPSTKELMIRYGNLDAQGTDDDSDDDDSDDDDSDDDDSDDDDSDGINCNAAIVYDIGEYNISKQHDVLINNKWLSKDLNRYIVSIDCFVKEFEYLYADY